MSQNRVFQYVFIPNFFFLNESCHLLKYPTRSNLKVFELSWFGLEIKKPTPPNSRLYDWFGLFYPLDLTRLEPCTPDTPTCWGPTTDLHSFIFHLWLLETTTFKHEEYNWSLYRNNYNRMVGNSISYHFVWKKSASFQRFQMGDNVAATAVTSISSLIIL